MSVKGGLEGGWIDGIHAFAGMTKPLFFRKVKQFIFQRDNYRYPIRRIKISSKYHEKI